MAIYKVFYGSMTATYGPSFIEAGSPEEAKRKFGSCFTDDERAVCMTAIKVSSVDIRQALYEKQNREED